jgi:hypothetical protein
MKTSELLGLNLTDFLNEIKQDLQKGKYQMKLADLQVISDIDIHNFLQRITDNFDFEKIQIVYNDIGEWLFFESKGEYDYDNIPFIIKQIIRMIESKTYNYIYDKTRKKLTDNSNFKDEYIEGLIKIGINHTHLDEAIIDGYNDAVNEIERKDFEDEMDDFLNTEIQVSEPTDEPQKITIPDNILQALQQAGFIENAAAQPLKWLKNKQRLRELLTYDKIKGTLGVAEIERQTPLLFIDKNGNS